MRQIVSIRAQSRREIKALCQKARRVLFCILAYLSLVAAPVSADALELEDISFRDRLFDVEVQGDKVFVVGFPGVMLRSTDRGENFSGVDVGMDDALFDIDIASDGTGAVVGRAGFLMTTTDFGKSWTKQKTEAKEHLFSVAVVPGGKIWAVGHFGTIIHSTDGGKSWAPQEYDATLPELPEGEKKIKVGRGRYEVTAEEENEGAIEEARLNSVSFADEKNGWITGEFGIVLHTDDGGETWKRQRSNVSLLMFTIRAIDKDKAIAVGTDGILIKTEDGGLHWNPVETGVSEILLGISLTGSRTIISGRDGLILVRDKPGNPFKRIPTGLYTWLGSIGMVDSRLGYIAGGRGYLLKTNDGGKTWKKLSGR
jgi:photosystem II stability/assembly factor-like uncharacterized protein